MELPARDEARGAKERSYRLQCGPIRAARRARPRPLSGHPLSATNHADRAIGHHRSHLREASVRTAQGPRQGILHLSTRIVSDAATAVQFRSVPPNDPAGLLVRWRRSGSRRMRAARALVVARYGTRIRRHPSRLTSLAPQDDDPPLSAKQIRKLNVESFASAIGMIVAGHAFCAFTRHGFTTM